MANDEKQAPIALLQYLPAVYQEHPFLGQFVLAFEKILLGREDEVQFSNQGLEETIAELAKFLDPTMTPDEFLPWLAKWAALSLRADWSKEQQREFLAQIIPLYRFRGTKDNLIELLKIYTGLEPTITEGDDTTFQIGVHSMIGLDTQLSGLPPHYFRVSVFLHNPDIETFNRKREIVAAIVELQKPAHTCYELQVDFTTMQIGVHSTIGVDTLLGIIPQ